MSRSEIQRSSPCFPHPSRDVYQTPVKDLEPFPLQRLPAGKIYFLEPLLTDYSSMLLILIATARDPQPNLP